MVSQDILCVPRYLVLSWFVWYEESLSETKETDEGCWHLFVVFSVNVGLGKLTVKSV